MIAVGAYDNYDPAILEPVAKTGHYEHYFRVQSYLTERHTDHLWAARPASRLTTFLSL